MTHFNRLRYGGLIISVVSVLTAGCAISDVSTKNSGEETQTPAKAPSRLVFVERGDAAGRNVGGVEALAPIVISPSTEQEEILQLMRYSRIMHNYPKSKIKDEFKRLAGEMVNDPATVTKLQMAIVLSIPKTSFANEKQAAQLLSEIINDTEQPSAAMQEYAYLLSENLQQRDEARKQQIEIMGELQNERQKREQSQEQVNALKEQLNALKSIEKSISQRQHTTDVPPEAETQ